MDSVERGVSLFHERFDMEDIGAKIKGSNFYRNYCCECSAPLRVDFERRYKKHLRCEQCSPRHFGCTSPPSPLTSEDEYSSSWKLASGLD